MFQKAIVTYCLILISLCLPARAAETIRLTNGEWPPLLSEHLPGNGFASQIVREAFKRADIDVSYGFFPWKRAFVLAEEGEWDGSVIWSWNEERDKAFLFSDPIYKSRDVFFHRKDFRLKWRKFEDLAGLNVGASTGYFYGTPFHEAADNGVFNLEMHGSDVKNLEKILAGRTDIFIVEEAVGQFLLVDQFSDTDRLQLTFHPHPVRITEMHLILSRNVYGNIARMKKFNEALRELRESGRVDELTQLGLN